MSWRPYFALKRNLSISPGRYEEWASLVISTDPPTPLLGASKLFNLLRRLVVKAEIYLTAPLTYNKLHQYLSWYSSLMSYQRVFFLHFIFLCPKGQKTEIMFFFRGFVRKKWKILHCLHKQQNRRKNSLRGHQSGGSWLILVLSTIVRFAVK